MTSHQKPADALRHLTYMGERLRDQIRMYESWPDDHPRKANLALSHEHNLSHAPALALAVVAVRLYERELHNEPHATDLLDRLVAAMRAVRGARTREEKIQGEALVEEAMESCGRFCDDLPDGGR